jgi:hypothetical protein
MDRKKKRHLQQFFVAAGRVYRAIALQRQKDAQTDPQTLWYMDRTEKGASYGTPFFRVLVAARKILPIHCLATIWGIHIQTDWWEGFMKYAV